MIIKYVRKISVQKFPNDPHKSGVLIICTDSKTSDNTASRTRTCKSKCSKTNTTPLNVNTGKVNILSYSNTSPGHKVKEKG